MSGPHFYLTLPSKASVDVFPDNKTSGYRVQLQQSIDLEGDWEVSLYSISYPRTWYTLQKNSNLDNKIYYHTPGDLTTGTSIAYGYYASIEDFIKATNTGIRGYGRRD